MTAVRPQGRTLNSGAPGTAPAGVERRPRASGDQPIEDVIWNFREWERSGHGLPLSNPIRSQSDPPIAVKSTSTSGNSARSDWPNHARNVD
jgi:hypothetical protein